MRIPRDLGPPGLRGADRCGRQGERHCAGRL